MVAGRRQATSSSKFPGSSSASDQVSQPGLCPAGQGKPPPDPLPSLLLLARASGSESGALAARSARAFPRPLDSIWKSQMWPDGALPTLRGTCTTATRQPGKLTGL
jgi:hypothetical protein